MTEASTIEPAPWLAGLIPTGTDLSRNASLVQPHRLPRVRPGQLWLVENPRENGQLPPLEYHAVTAANVVIYERELACMIARVLPLGAYAEPAPAEDETDEATLRRCIGFVRDGWSVTRMALPAISRERAGQFRQLSERLLALDMPADLSAWVFAGVSGVYREIRTRLDLLEDGVNSCGTGEWTAITIVFNAVEADTGSRSSIASANGLAG